MANTVGISAKNNSKLVIMRRPPTGRNYSVNVSSALRLPETWANKLLSNPGTECVPGRFRRNQASAYSHLQVF